MYSPNNNFLLIKKQIKDSYGLKCYCKKCLFTVANLPQYPNLIPHLLIRSNALIRWGRIYLMKPRVLTPLRFTVCKQVTLFNWIVGVCEADLWDELKVSAGPSVKLGLCKILQKGDKGASASRRIHKNSGPEVTGSTIQRFYFHQIQSDFTASKLT